VPRAASIVTYIEHVKREKVGVFGGDVTPGS